MNQPPPMPWLTDEQREAISTHIANVNAQLRSIVEAVRPAVLAAVEQMAQLAKALQEAAEPGTDRPARCERCGATSQCPLHAQQPKEPRS